MKLKRKREGRKVDLKKAGKKADGLPAQRGRELKWDGGVQSGGQHRGRTRSYHTDMGYIFRCEGSGGIQSSGQQQILDKMLLAFKY
jgi:hypothetical protein